MTEPPSGVVARLVDTVLPGSKVTGTHTLSGGLSAHMTVLEIRTPDGTHRRLVLRRPIPAVLAARPGSIADEFRTLRTLSHAGLPVAAPLLLDQSCTILPTPYLVMEYVDGHADYAPADPAGAAAQMGKTLTCIHATNLSLSGLASLPRRPHAFATRLRDLPADRTSALDEGAIRATLRPFWSMPPAQVPVLLHGDFWPGNTLWRDGRLIGVVDWEDAEIGDPLADLAISRLDTLLIYGRDASMALTRAYAKSSGISLGALPYWDLLAALRAATAIGEWATGFPALGRPDLTEERLREELRWFAAGALERAP